MRPTPLIDRVAHAVRPGPMTITQVAEALGASRDRVRLAISVLVDAGEVIPAGMHRATGRPAQRFKGRVDTAARIEVLPMVEADLRTRVEKGWREYGEPLTTRNGRDALRDAYEEALDLAMYLRQALAERDGT